MLKRRQIAPKMIPGKSITRLHLVTDNPRSPRDFEIHASRYPDGDILEPAQWYKIYPQPIDQELKLLREEIGVDEDDWKIISHLLGSFYWVMIEHAVPPERDRIVIDEKAMRGGEWSTVYF